MTPAEFEIDETADGHVALRLVGDWTTTSLGKTPARLDAALKGRTVVSVDAGDMGKFDTAGALSLVKASNFTVPKSAFQRRPGAGRIYAMVEKLERESGQPPRQSDPITQLFAKIGRGVFDFFAEFMLSMAFLGRLVMAVGSAARHPGSIRWTAWTAQIERAGLDAMPIVIITNFFIGAVIAFLGADILTQFGASVFAVQLIAVAVFREFAVVITAVLLAGRSSSSFAAEIGSMRMNQETDAMEVMGVNTFQALVIPRLAAMLIMMPLLTFAGVLAGLLGGSLVTWNALSLGPAFFVQRISQDPYMFTHLMVGLSKAPVFAVVVAAIGCRQGMAVAGDVESLGKRVTAAVVQAIFAIIFLDAVFALIYLELNL